MKKEKQELYDLMSKMSTSCEMSDRNIICYDTIMNIIYQCDDETLTKSKKIALISNRE